MDGTLAGMRLKLDLSDFLEDERKFSVLKVKPKETKTVQDVITKISRLFSVPGGEEEGETWAGGSGLLVVVSIGLFSGVCVWFVVS